MATASLMRVFLTEADHHEGEPTYRALVKLLLTRGVAGATAVRGLYGFGRGHELHAASPLRLSTALPVVVESVDDDARLRAVLPEVHAMVGGALVTLQPVERVE